MTPATHGHDPDAERPDAEGRRAPAPKDDDVPYAPGANWVEEQRGSLQYAGVGLQFGFTLCLFALAGHWLDGRLGTGPGLLLVGVLLGFGGGTLSLVKKFQ